MKRKQFELVVYFVVSPSSWKFLHVLPSSRKISYCLCSLELYPRTSTCWTKKHHFPYHDSHNTRAMKCPGAHGLDFFSWRWEARGAIGPASSSTHAALGGAGFFISTPARSPYHLRARILHGYVPSDADCTPYWTRMGQSPLWVPMKTCGKSSRVNLS